MNSVMQKDQVGQVVIPAHEPGSIAALQRRQILRGMDPGSSPG
jgi:hypothetical protein